MRGPSHGRLRQQVDTLRQEFLQGGTLPFAETLSSACLAEAMAEIKAAWNDRIFTPLVTLWVFLGQVLNADQSCRAAVARLIAHRVAEGLPPCSSETGAYCRADVPIRSLARSPRRASYAAPPDSSPDRLRRWSSADEAPTPSHGPASTRP